MLAADSSRAPKGQITVGGPGKGQPELVATPFPDQPAQLATDPVAQQYPVAAYPNGTLTAVAGRTRH